MAAREDGSQQTEDDDWAMREVEMELERMRTDGSDDSAKEEASEILPFRPTSQSTDTMICSHYFDRLQRLGCSLLDVPKETSTSEERNDREDDAYPPGSSERVWPRVETTPPVTPAQLLAEDKTELSRPTCEEDMLCAVDGSEIKQQAEFLRVFEEEHQKMREEQLRLQARLEEMRGRRESSAASLIQAAWKGWRVRKMVKERLQVQLVNRDTPTAGDPDTTVSIVPPSTPPKTADIAMHTVGRGLRTPPPTTATPPPTTATPPPTTATPPPTTATPPPTTATPPPTTATPPPTTATPPPTTATPPPTTATPPPTTATPPPTTATPPPSTATPPPSDRCQRGSSNVSLKVDNEESLPHLLDNLVSQSSSKQSDAAPSVQSCSSLSSNTGSLVKRLKTAFDLMKGGSLQEVAVDEVTREKMLELRKTLLQPSSSSACLEGKGFHGNKSCQDDTSCKKKVVRSQSVVFPITSAVPARRVHSLEEENPDDIKQTEKRRETEWEREKRALDRLERSILEEELAAQTSRERMAQLNSQLQSTLHSPLQNQLPLEVVLKELSDKAWEGLVMERQEEWLKRHTLWDNQDRKTLVTEDNPFIRHMTTPPPGSKPLTTLQLLSASPKGTQLEQVVYVSVFGVKHPIDLKSLSVCQKLTSVNIGKCNLKALTGIHGNKRLKEIIAQSNGIEYVNLDGLSRLFSLDLTGNALTSVHGLEGCPKLVELILNSNRITKLPDPLLGGLEGSRQLRYLFMEGNMLISAAGLDNLGELEQLSLAENHLTKLGDVTQCVLLQKIQLQQNNIQQFPYLENNVLLREIDLSENCLDNIKPITSSWLPLLQKLNLSCNCITVLESLLHCIMLSELDISNNSLTDVSLLLQSLKGCYKLRSLNLTGNHIASTPKLQSMLLKMLPSLAILNGSQVKRSKPVLLRPNHVLYSLCERLVKEQDDLKEQHLSVLGRLNEVSYNTSEVLTTKVAQSNEYHYLLISHLRELEYFGSEKAANLNNQHERERLAAAAVVFQKVWRGRQMRKTLLSRKWLAVVRIQKTWRGYSLRKRLWLHLSWLHKRQERLAVRHKAAVAIQACFRGYHFRKKLSAILESAKVDMLEYEDLSLVAMEIEDINKGSKLIDDSWSPLALSPPPETLLSNSRDSPPSPDCYSPSDIYSNLPKVPSGSNYREVPSNISPPSQGKNESTMLVDQYALPGAVEEEIGYDKWREVTYKSTHPYLATPLTTPTKVSTPDEHESQSEDQLEMSSSDIGDISNSVIQPRPPSKEDSWNLKDPRTIAMMKRRHQRHKKLAESAKHRSKMTNPVERLEVFKKQALSQPPIKPPEKTFKRQEYVSKESTRSTPTPSPTEQANKKEFIQAWVQRQQFAREQQVDRMWNTKKSKMLPNMEPHILAGHRARLISSSAQNKVVEKCVSNRKLDSLRLTSSQTSVHEAGIKGQTFQTRSSPIIQITKEHN